ncbi:MAG: radical SAM protein [Thermoanaerobaculales bacterium]|nr:radical SAM protein [Thermoanaerobaculales bacterium]
MVLKKFLGLVELHNSWRSGELIRGFSVTLELAFRCNLRCVFCSRWNDPEDLSLEVIEQVAADMSQLDAGYVSLTGGEPFVRKDIKEIIEVFEDAGIPIHINTNGVLLGRFADYLRSKADSFIGITVSLDSSEAELHDEIRGVEGAFRKAIAGIEAVRESIPVSIACTLNHRNLGEIETFAEFARSHGYSFRFQPLHNDGDNQLSPNEEGVDVEASSLNGLTARLESTLTPADDYSLRQYYRLFEPFFRDRAGMKSLRCTAAARTIFFVDPIGDVYPCDTRRDVNLGNVYQRRFLEIARGRLAKDWRTTCQDGENGCWCMYACVAPMNVRNQFLPLVPIFARGFPVGHRWKSIEDRLRHQACDNQGGDIHD